MEATVVVAVFVTKCVLSRIIVLFYVGILDDFCSSKSPWCDVQMHCV